ncbi:MAG: hypothetical protein ACKORM_00585, partial [Solirubrobacterales bacterium]
MSDGHGNLDRRGFLGIAGGALVCTIAGLEVRVDEPADLARLGSRVPVPPRVAAGSGDGVLPRSALPRDRREYWIQAEPTNWNIMPTKVDQMMPQRVARFEHRQDVGAQVLPRVRLARNGRCLVRSCIGVRWA